MCAQNNFGAPCQIALQTEHMLIVADLDRSSETAFVFSPAAQLRNLLAIETGIIAIKRLRLAGDIFPHKDGNLTLKAQLTASVKQQCVVSLNPVSTRISTSVERRFVAGQPFHGLSRNCPMPEDDSIEPLGKAIDLLAISREVLVLELPLYPRRPGATLPQGAAEIADDKPPGPFSTLADLRHRMPIGKH